MKERGTRGATSCPTRRVARARSCPALHPCASPPRTGIWLTRTICSFRPVAMVTGWLEMGLHQRRPEMLGKKCRQGKVFLFFLGGNEGEREGSCRWRLLPFLPPCALSPAVLSPAPPAHPLSLPGSPFSLLFGSPVHACSSSEIVRCCAGVCREVSCPPQAWWQAVSPRGAARRGCGTSPSSGAGLFLCPSPDAVPV